MNTSFLSPPCVMCGKRTEISVPTVGWEKYKAGELIQRAFPDMSPQDREMIMTGTHPECWNIMWEEEEF
jgi:hypothetical protein